MAAIDVVAVAERRRAPVGTRPANGDPNISGSSRVERHRHAGREQRGDRRARRSTGTSPASGSTWGTRRRQTARRPDAAHEGRVLHGSARRGRSAAAQRVERAAHARRPGQLAGVGDAHESRRPARSRTPRRTVRAGGRLVVGEPEGDHPAPVDEPRSCAWPTAFAGVGMRSADITRPTPDPGRRFGRRRRPRRTARTPRRREPAKRPTWSRRVDVQLDPHRAVGRRVLGDLAEQPEQSSGVDEHGSGGARTAR